MASYDTCSTAVTGPICCSRHDCVCGSPTISCAYGYYPLPGGAARLPEAVMSRLQEAVERLTAPDPSGPPDMVNQPSHYSRMTIEPATFAMANGLDFLTANAVKYVVRAPYKNGVEDYRKAIRCIEMRIEVLSRKNRIAGGESREDVWKVML